MHDEISEARYSLWLKNYSEKLSIAILTKFRLDFKYMSDVVEMLAG